jgi:hypothetical protein
MLSIGDLSEVKVAALLLERSGPKCGLLGEKGNNTSSLRKSLRGAGTSPSPCGWP